MRGLCPLPKCLESTLYPWYEFGEMNFYPAMKPPSPPGKKMARGFAVAFLLFAISIALLDRRENAGTETLICLVAASAFATAASRWKV